MGKLKTMTDKTSGRPRARCAHQSWSPGLRQRFSWRKSQAAASASLTLGGGAWLRPASPEKFRFARFGAILL